MASSKGTLRLPTQPLGHRPTRRFQPILPTNVCSSRGCHPLECNRLPQVGQSPQRVGCCARHANSCATNNRASNSPICNAIQTRVVSRSAFLNCSHCCSHSGRLRQSCSRECIIITTFVMGQDYYRLSFFLCSLCSKSTVPQTIILPQPLDTPIATCGRE